MRPGHWIIGADAVTQEAHSEELWVGRFLPKMLEDQQTLCWEWTGALTRRGYVRVHVRSGVFYLHRIALARRLGRELVEGECACHTCDNPRCCNPFHLFAATQLENIKDRDSKFRQKTKRGEEHKLAKLTESYVREARELYALGGISYSELASRYGVHKKVIMNAVKGRTWVHA